MSSYNNFNWKTYINNYDDLKYIKDKNEAWKHWINNGKKENRATFNLSEHLEEYNNFDWNSYVNNYQDLKLITDKNSAWLHWVNYGKKENRVFTKNIQETEDTFDWNTYVNNYQDLKSITDRNSAWLHWTTHGKNEKRVVYNLYEKDVAQFKELCKDDVLFVNNKNLILKTRYQHYGLHYFGWEKVMSSFISYFLQYSFVEKLQFNQPFFFDEWIEKLLIWGNKIENAIYLQEIYKSDCKFISFIHNPPYENLDRNNMNIHNEVLFNEDLLNNYMIRIISQYQLNDKIQFLYTLSNTHKEYLYNKYPEYKNKLLSVYHPIEVSHRDRLFEFELFFKNRKIVHVGWWLRNFKTFIELQININKCILVKNDFQDQWRELSQHYNLENIEVISELNNEAYENIFTNSCIFIDLEDTVANNVILECIRFNTPVITRKNHSSVEYLGENYPLFITQDDKFQDSEYLYKRILSANEYLMNMDKTHVSLETFHKKVSYDLSKLQFGNTLTWFYFDSNENNISDLVECFLRQYNTGLVLKIITKNVDKFRNYINTNISCIISDVNEYVDFLNIAVENTNTEFLTIVDKNYPANYSNIVMNYFSQNPNCDFICKINEIEVQKDTMIFNHSLNSSILSTNMIWRKKIHNVVGPFENSSKNVFQTFLEKCIRCNLNIFLLE